MRNRAGVVLAAAVAVLVLLAVVAGVLSATRSSTELPAGSPEAAVQDYLTAVEQDDVDAAATHLDPDGGCTADDLENYGGGSTARVVLRDTEVAGDEAEVRVDIVTGGGGLFGGGDGFRDQQQFDLRRDGDRWVITGEPWPMFFCEGARRP